jgi:hypothetical protein
LKIERAETNHKMLSHISVWILAFFKQRYWKPAKDIHYITVYLIRDFFAAKNELTLNKVKLKTEVLCLQLKLGLKQSLT